MPEAVDSEFPVVEQIFDRIESSSLYPTEAVDAARQGVLALLRSISSRVRQILTHHLSSGGGLPSQPAVGVNAAIKATKLRAFNPLENVIERLTPLHDHEYPSKAARQEVLALLRLESNVIETLNRLFRT